MPQVFIERIPGAQRASAVRCRAAGDQERPRTPGGFVVQRAAGSRMCCSQLSFLKSVSPIERPLPIREKRMRVTK